jgi:hypothetical protein
MMHTWFLLVERAVSALERIADSVERRVSSPPAGKARRGLREARAPRRDALVPNELDRARAKKTLNKLGY